MLLPHKQTSKVLLRCSQDCTKFTSSLTGTANPLHRSPQILSLFWLTPKKPKPCIALRVQALNNHILPPKLVLQLSTQLLDSWPTGAEGRLCLKTAPTMKPVQNRVRHVKTRNATMQKNSVASKIVELCKNYTGFRG